MHTSTVTVAVIDPNVKVDEKYSRRSDSDFRIEWFSGTGAGGQHRNKCQNSCRMIHIPTGLVQQAMGRERSSNLRDAKAALLEMLDEEVRKQRYGVLSSTRKEQVGSGMRGDKVRTIRFQDDTATDHNSGKRITATEYMKGHMDKLWG